MKGKETRERTGNKESRKEQNTAEEEMRGVGNEIGEEMKGGEMTGIHS